LLSEKGKHISKKHNKKKYYIAKQIQKDRGIKRSKWFFATFFSEINL